MKRLDLYFLCALFFLTFSRDIHPQSSGIYSVTSYAHQASPVSYSVHTSCSSRQQHFYRPSYHNRYAFNDSRIDISHLSAKQLRSYFKVFNATPDQILNNPLWFMSDEFITVVHDFPEYQAALKKHAAKLSALTFLKKCTGWLTNRYCKGLKKRIEKLLQQNTKNKLLNSGYSSDYPQVIESLENDLEKHADDYNPDLYVQRKEALERTPEEGYTQTTRTYTESFSNTLHNLDPKDVNTFTGNAYEHQIHREFLTQLKELKHIFTIDNAVTRAIENGIAHGIKANHEHKTKVATTWADYGWKALSIARSMFEGVGEGTIRTAQAFIHPIQALQNIACGLYALAMLAESTRQLVKDCEDALFSGNIAQFAQTARTIGAYAQIQAKSLKESLIATPPEDTAREVTATITEFLLSHKLWKTLATQLPKGLAHAHTCIDHEISQLRNIPQTKPLLASVEASYEITPALTRTTALLMEESEAAAAKNVAQKAAQKAAQKIGAVAAGPPQGPKIIHKIKRSLIPVWTDIQKLQKQFDGKHFFESEPITLDYAHLYSYEEKIPVTRSGHMKKSMLHGGHHDYGRCVEKAHNIKYENVVEGVAGSFKAEPVINGIKYRAKTYFSPDWTEEHTIDKIFEAFENRHSMSELDTSKCYTIRGRTSEGLEIKMFLDTTAWYITTAFPD